MCLVEINQVFLSTLFSVFRGFKSITKHTGYKDSKIYVKEDY